MRSTARALVGPALLLGASLVVMVEASPTAAVPAVRCAGRLATIVGTEGRNDIVGTPGDDVIAGLGRNDRIRGRGGNDVICGGRGADDLAGGPGSDRLYGGLDARWRRVCDNYMIGDVILPGPGNDFVDGGDDPRQQTSCVHRPDRLSFRRAHSGIRADLADPGELGVVRGEGRDVVVGENVLDVDGTRYDDRMAGGSGDEALRGNGGTDSLSGGAGDDRLSDDDYRGDALAGDRLTGGPGADSLLSWQGPDALVGGVDDDAVLADYSCNAVLGGPGTDLIQLSPSNLPTGTASLSLDASAGTVAALPGQPACGRLADLERYTMVGPLPLQFVGTDAAEELRGPGAAGLTASMLGGDDLVVGGDADDVIDAGDGNDDVDAGLGRDVCIGAETAASCEYDALPLPPPTCEGLLATLVAGVHGGTLVGTPGNDVIAGSDAHDYIDGRGGNDVICGRAGADTILGGEGDDHVLAGEDSRDPEGFFVGDTVLPGPGDDIVDLGSDPRRPEGSVGDRLDYSGSATGIVADLAPVDGVFTVVGEGTDSVAAQAPFVLQGSNQADVITGSSSNDRILGMGGDDVIDGGPGEDYIRGEDGCSFTGCRNERPDHDIIRGGDGDDDLAAGWGLDEIEGGDGNDFLNDTYRHGPQRMDAGPGDDSVQLVVAGSMDAAIDGGPGSDRLDVVGDDPIPIGSRIAIDVARGTLVASAVEARVSLAGFERYGLTAYLGGGGKWLDYLFLGSEAAEVVDLQAYGPTTLHARMRGGDDVVRTAEGDDVVNGGPGFDRIRAHQGNDTCRAFEVAHGCEVEQISP